MSMWKTGFDQKRMATQAVNQTPGRQRRRSGWAVIAASLVAMILTVSPAMGDIYDRVDRSATGGIQGEATEGGRLKAAIIFEPVTHKVYRANVDPEAGTFKISGLPPGRYDVVLHFEQIVVEGASLRPPGGAMALQVDDVKAIQAVIWESDAFFNDKTIVAMSANDEHARVLVCQVSERKLQRPDGSFMTGQKVRRFETTDLQKAGQVWQIRKTRHLWREEALVDSQVAFRYCKSLSRIRVGESMKSLEPVNVKTLRDKRDPAESASAHWRETPRQ